MKTMILILAGALSLSTVYGSDPFFEERLKMKTGRYSPAEEARRENARLAATQAKAKVGMSCDKHGCCTRTEQASARPAATLGDPGAEERFKMKYGRSTPAEEARIATAKKATAEPVLLASARTCDGDCCKNHQ